MKCLSIRSPWWWFILYGGKTIENRVWPNCRYRGPILIHASNFWKKKEVEADAQIAWDIAAKQGIHVSLQLERMRELGSHIVGQAELVDCVTKSDNPWFFGPTGLVFENARAFDRPIPQKGCLGFFEVSDDLVEDQLK